MSESFNVLISDFERESNLRVIRLGEELSIARGERVPQVAGAPAGLEPLAGPNTSSMIATAEPRAGAQAMLDSAKATSVAQIEDDLAHWTKLHKWAKDGYLYIDPFDQWFVSFQIERSALVGAASACSRVYYERRPRNFPLAGDKYFTD